MHAKAQERVRPELKIYPPSPWRLLGPDKSEEKEAGGFAFLFCLQIRTYRKRSAQKDPRSHIAPSADGKSPASPVQEAGGAAPVLRFGGTNSQCTIRTIKGGRPTGKDEVIHIVYSLP